MLNLLARLYGRVRAAWPVNRVVTVLTPLVFAPAAGYVASWVPQHVPGLALHPTRAQLVGLFALGATRALVIAYEWLDGWQRHEQHVAWAQDAASVPSSPPPAPVVTIHNTPPATFTGDASPSSQTTPASVVPVDSTAPPSPQAVGV